MDINEWQVSMDAIQVSIQIFLSEVLNRSKFCRIVFIFCGSRVI